MQKYQQSSIIIHVQKCSMHLIPTTEQTSRRTSSSLSSLEEFLCNLVSCYRWIEKCARSPPKNVSPYFKKNWIVKKRGKIPESQKTRNKSCQFIAQKKSELWRTNIHTCIRTYIHKINKLKIKINKFKQIKFT